jgi:DNA-binding transcriptional LysR family regulator
MTMVAEGYLEAALVSMPIPDRDLLVHHICTEEMLVCLRKDDPLAAQQALPKEVIEERLRVLFARPHHPMLYDQFIRKFAKAEIRLRPTDFISAPGEAQFLVKSHVGLGLVRESVSLDPELTMRRIEGVSLRIKTAFICHPTQQRPVLQLLAYRLAKKCSDAVEMNRRKRPSSAVGHEGPRQLHIFA